jgi:stalled ribosome rescue protein Dom34
MGTSASKNSLTREEARRYIRTLNVQDGNVLAIKAGTRLGNKESIQALSRAFAATKRTKVVIVVVDDFDDLSVLDEEGMNKLGWYRK